MKLTVSRKEESRFGLDIGTRFIKAVEIASSSDKMRLLKFHVSEIASPATPEKVDQTLKSLLEKLKPSTKEVRIALSAPHAIVRFINLPRMKEEDLKNSLKYEAEKYLPFNVNEVITDVVILEDTLEDKKQMRVLLAAAKKDIVDSRMTLMKNNNLTPIMIDIDSFACFNVFCNVQGPTTEAKGTALLNIGYTQTNVIILSQGKAFFTRDIQIGGKNIVKAVAQQLNVEEKIADNLLQDPKEKAAEVLEASKTILSTLMDELRLSFGYYENQYGAAISEIYVSGGLAKLNGLAEQMEESFGAKPILWDPFKKFELAQDINKDALEAAKPMLAVSAGLTIRK